MQGIGEGEAASATDLTGGPAQEQRLAAGVLIERESLGFAGRGEERIVGGEFGEGRERGFRAEFFEDEFLRAGADAAAAGEDGLAAGRQFLDECEDGVAVLFDEALKVIEDEQCLRASQCLQQQAWTLVLGALGDLGQPEFAGEFIEEFDKSAEDEPAEIAHAIVVQLASLQRDEDDLFEHVRRRIVGRADGQ